MTDRDTDRDTDHPAEATEAAEPSRPDAPQADETQADEAQAGRPGLDRRGLIRTGLATGAVTALGLAAATPAGAADATPDRTTVLAGHLPTGAPDFVLLPFEVPTGVREIAVSYGYDRPTVPAGTPGNSCDIGLFDERGTELGGRGFRGWSGGFRTEFTVARDRATPGYLPGPIRPGRWHVVLGPYQVAPQGLDYRVQVTLRFGAPGPEFTRPTRRSGPRAGARLVPGRLPPAHRALRRAPAPGRGGGGRPGGRAGLHRLDRPQHHLLARCLGAAGRPRPADRARRGGHHPQRPLAGAGPGARAVRRLALPRARRGLPRFARQVRRQGGLVVPAHPYCPYVACQWKFGYQDADAVEVWNGPWTYDDESAVDTWDAQLAVALREGRPWLPAVGNSDAHSAPQVIGSPHTVVRAEDLTRDAILDGLRTGRSWLAESAAVQLDLTATGQGRQAGIGEQLTVPADAPVDVRLTVSGVPGGTVRLLTDEGQLHQESLPADGTGTVIWRTTASLAAYVRAEVRHPRADGTPGRGNAMGPDLPWGPMAALTNPIVLRSPKRPEDR